MKQKQILLLSAAAALLIGLAGWRISTGGGSDKIQLAIIPKGTTHSFWKAVHAGALKAAEDNGGIEIFWNGPAREGDREGQISIIEDFLSKNVDGFVIAPLDAKALVTPVKRIHSRGKPVVIIDSGIDTDKIDSFVATDNYQGGVMAARKMGELTGGKGSVLVIRYMPGSRSTELREQGFIDTVKKEFPAMKVSADKFAGDTVQAALSAAEDLLTSYPDTSGIFGSNESTSVGALRALEGRKLTGKVKMVGFDSSEYLVKALRDNRLQALVVQNPYKMGYEGVVQVLHRLQNKVTPVRLDTGVQVATSQNIDLLAAENPAIPAVQ